MSGANGSGGAHLEGVGDIGGGAPGRLRQEGAGLALAGLACGVLAFFAFGIILGTLALVLGALSQDVRPSPFAKASLAAGLIALLWSFGLLVVGG